MTADLLSTPNLSVSECESVVSSICGMAHRNFLIEDIAAVGIPVFVNSVGKFLLRNVKPDTILRVVSLITDLCILPNNHDVLTEFIEMISLRTMHDDLNLWLTVIDSRDLTSITTRILAKNLVYGFRRLNVSAQVNHAVATVGFF
jgi:hypothetical protein